MHVLRQLCIFTCVSTLAGCANAVLGNGTPDSGGTGDPTVDARPGTADAADNINACEGVPSGWSRVGTPIDPPGGLFDLGDVAIDASGRPVVVFSAGAPADGYAYRFDGTNWSQLGNPFNINEGGGVYDLSIRAMGNDLVAMFLEAGGATSTGVYLQRLPDGGTAWQLMGGGDLTTTNANVVGSDMFVDDDELLVAWSQYSDGVIGRSRVHVRRFSGDAYVPLNPFMGGIAGPGASAITPSLAMDGDGNEVVFFSETGVRHLQRNAGGTDWTYLGEVTPANSINGGFSPKSATDSLGRVLLVMAERSETENQNLAYLQRWNGSSWDALGSFQGAAAENTHSTPADMILDSDDNPIIAITEPVVQSGSSQLFVGKRSAGDTFTTLGGGNLTGGDGTQSVLSPQMVRDECGFHILFGEAIDAESERIVHIFRWKD